MLALAFVSHPPISLGLKPGEVSPAQERRAGFRAIAALDPDEKVRNPDYLAGRLLPQEFWFFGLLRYDYTSTKEFIDAHRISAYYTANAVTWHIDAILKNMAERGVKQVVHIGAGFDSRPYRFGSRMPGVRFFELDLPATQDQKKKMVRAVLGELPANVTYIPYDYRSKPFFPVLRRGGYRHRWKTLFIWEGTTMLADLEVVDDTLRSIAELSVPGSEVVFDYVLEAVVRKDFRKYRAARYEVIESAAKGEPWKFGIARGQTDEFVEQRGLDVISDLGADALARNYLVRSNGSRDGMPTPHYRIAHAAVRDQGNPD